MRSSKFLTWMRGSWIPYRSISSLESLPATSLSSSLSGPRLLLTLYCLPWRLAAVPLRGVEAAGDDGALRVAPPLKEPLPEPLPS